MAPSGGSTGGGGGGGNVKVVVRVRPFNNRELDRNATCVVQMKGEQTVLVPPPDADPRTGRSSKGIYEGQKTFKYDKSYWSFNKDDPHFAGQDALFTDLGTPLLDNAFKGYNNCIFAYGQTGSGKSYSMMGYGEEAGVIPRICRDMFDRMEEIQNDPNLKCTVEVSYLEIYNERVRDLLNPATKGNLRVREHPSTGPYVEDLAKLAVRSFPEIENLMDEGNKARTVAATNMNETSSRSHAVFTLTLTQQRHDVETRMNTEKVAKISLVDLAGSERATSTGATGARLKEGAEINRSLSTLGRVIAALADLSAGKKGKVPYRDSVLTWLLKDSLGGNSMTAMIAAISPADINFEETLSTLRYADSAKRIKNHAVVNEDPNARMIRELKEELAQLRSKLAGGTGASAAEDIYPEGTPLDQQFVTIIQADGSTKRVSKADIQDQLSQSEKLYKDLNQTWEEKLLQTEAIHKERETALEELGISIEKGNVGMSTPKKMPHLVNLSDDPLLAECLVYNLKPGTTTVGNVGATETLEIRLNGSKILEHHCKLENVDNAVTIIPTEGAAVMVNGVRVDKSKRLKSGNRIILGDFHIFRFNNPLESKAERVERSLLRHSVTASQMSSPSPFRPAHDRSMSNIGSEIDGDSSRADSPSLNGRDSDWSFARREAANALLGKDPNITQMTDEELDQLFDSVQRARDERKGRPESKFFEGEYDSDDLTSILMRDKYMSGGTMDNFSFDTALTMPDTPSISEDPENDADVTLKASQLDMQHQLDEQKAAYEAELDSTESTAAKEAAKEEEAIRMRQELERQKQEFQEELRKQKEAFEEQVKKLEVESRRPPRTGPSGYTELTASERSIARIVVDKWQQRNVILVAEALLQSAGLLKEAQVMSRLLDQNSSFQFAILEAGQERCSSYDLIMHDISGDDDMALADARKPCLAVRVVDAQLSCIHVWSIEKLRERVARMRQMYQYKDQPEYLQHFRLDNPFKDSDSPLFSLIGDGSIPLTAVFETRVQDFVVEVTSPFSRHTVGRVRLSLEPSMAESPPSTIKFNVVMRDLIGFSENEGSNVHAQMSVTGTADESVATTHTVAGFKDGPVRFESIHNMSVAKSGERSAVLKIAIFAQVTSTHLDKLTSWDELREMMEIPRDRQPAHRMPESEFDSEERHDVFVKVQFLELAENGQYMPVEVVQSTADDDGVHQLHQGLQRRISITLIQSQSESLPWDDLKSLRLGEIHLIDSSGRTADIGSLTPDLSLKQIQEPMIKDNADGTSNVTIIGQWDSSLHKSLLLDRATNESCRIRVSLRWDIVSSRLEQPMTFSILQHIQILPRAYLRPQSVLKSFWNSTRVVRSSDGLFSIVVRPASTKRAADLWRLDTSKDYINGEELLGSWTPRGISLVKDYILARRKRRQIQDIESAKATLGLKKLSVHGKTKSRASSPSQPNMREEQLLHKFVSIWKKPGFELSNPIFEDDSEETNGNSAHNDPTSQSRPPSRRKTKYLGTVTNIPRNPQSLKSGHLLMPSETHDPAHQSMQWKRRFVDLRPPHLLIYSVPDGESMNAINLTYARIDHDPDFKRLLGGAPSETSPTRSEGGGGGRGHKRGTSADLSALQHVFAVYGEQNTFLFAARSETQKGDWILKIDQSFVGDQEEGVEGEIL